MDFCKFGIILLISFVLRVTAEENVPVLIWETKSSNSSEVLPPALAKISTSDFMRIFSDKLLSYRKPPLVLVFVEEKLSTEDFGWKDETGQGSFPRLTVLTKQSAKTTFFPTISEPITGLKQALFQRGFTIKTLNLNVKSPDSDLNLESVQSIDHVQTSINYDESIVKTAPDVDLNVNSFINQNYNIETVQSLDKNTEEAKIKGDESESVSKSEQSTKFTEKFANEISVSNAIMFRLGAPNPQESRPSALRRHDGEIVQAFAARLSTQVDVIGIYTAHAAAFDYEGTKLRSRRQDETPPQDSEPPKSNPKPADTKGPDIWSEETGTILIYFHTFSPLYESSETNVQDMVVAEIISSERTLKYLKLLVKGTVAGGEVHLAFCFSLTTSYWELAMIEATVADGQTVKLLPPSGDVVVARGYSYTCRGGVVFTNGKIRITLTNFQMQAFMTEPKFSVSQDCVSYFSVGIWSGVVVMFIITLVLSWAITMIMSIRVNDKFDDRFGKTIHVGPGN